MKRVSIPACLFVAALIFPSSSASAGGTRVTTDSPPVCNCLSVPADLEVCTSSEATIAFGGQVITVSVTGGTSECATMKDAPPGVCIYFKYIFECDSSGWWWWYTVDCTFVKKVVKESKATAEDCA